MVAAILQKWLQLNLSSPAMEHRSKQAAAQHNVQSTASVCTAVLEVHSWFRPNTSTDHNRKLRVPALHNTPNIHVSKARWTLCPAAHIHNYHMDSQLDSRRLVGAWTHRNTAAQCLYRLQDMQ